MGRTEGSCPMSAQEVAPVLDALSTGGIIVWLED
jgi:hypothetical protein